MSELVIRDLRASADGFEILRGVDLEVRSGEVHAVMGPNGSGKSTLSHVILGRSDYEVTAGSVTLDGEELLGLPTWERAARGLFLAMQYPVAVPGVPVGELVAAAARTRGEDPVAFAARVDTEAARLAVSDEFLARADLEVDPAEDLEAIGGRAQVADHELAHEPLPISTSTSSPSTRTL